MESTVELDNNLIKLSNKNLCPRCGQPGSGPYARWVRNSKGKRYEPYYYFAHHVNGKLTWCYISKKSVGKVLDNIESKALSNITIENKDAVIALSEIAPNSVDLIFTDPPYAREYNYLYGVLTKEAKRILKPGAYCFAYCGADSLPHLFELMSPYLQWFWLFEIKHNGGYPRIWNKKLWVGSKTVLVWTKGPPNRLEWLSTLHVSEKADKQFHKWGQSVGFPRKIIEMLTEENDLVVDPFLGGGTTAKVCKELNRRFIGFDVDQKCLDVSAKRLCQEQIFAFMDKKMLDNKGTALSNSIFSEAAP